MRRIVSLGSVGFVCLFVVGCTIETKSEEPSTSPPASGDGQAKPGETAPAPAAPVPAAGGGTACDFTPANAVGCESGPSAELGATCDALEIDTTSGKFACGIAAPSKLIDQGPGNPKIRVFYVNGLRIGRETKVRVTGTNALAIVSRGDVVIEGILDVSAENRECDAGPGGYRGGASANGKGDNGFGLGGGMGALYPAGAGGASYGGAGGGGGSDVGSTPVTGAAAGAKYGNVDLVPLLGGSGGGGDDGWCGGAGGGAVQITSSTSILVVAGGGINAGGGSSKGYYGGGGSGGAILVEAPEVEVEGTLAANGGGGSYGCGGDLASTPACGGSTYEAGGGVGSSGIDGNGAPGADADGYGSGGGGGAGRIRIATRADGAKIAGTISPALSTQLSTQALIAQ